MLPSLSIFFPFYNDEGTVRRQIEAAFKTGSQLTGDLEIIAIHGGNSRDNTWQEIQKTKLNFPDLVVVDASDNREGYAVIKRGFSASTKGWVFYTDGDAQYHLEEDLPQLVNAQLTTGADVINGYKRRRSDNLLRQILGALYKKVSVLMFSLPIRDVDCDFRLISKKLLDKITFDSHDASILPELVKKLELTGAKFTEVAVSHYPRIWGTSNYSGLDLFKEKIIGDWRLFLELRSVSKLPTKYYEMNLEEYDVMYSVEKNHWWYRGLRALLLWWVEKIKPSKILDVGCGTGINALTLQKAGYAVTGVDSSAYALDFCRRRGLSNLKQSFSQTLDFPAGTFDCVLLMDMLYMLKVEDISRTLAEVSRCLTPKGYVIINSATYQWLFSTHDKAVNTVKRYSLEELSKFLTEAGFRVLYKTHRVTFLFPFIAFVKIVEKFLIGRSRSNFGDLGKNSPLVNSVLTPIMLIESFILRFISLPFGSSVFIVAQKI